ncbi:MAG: branched-chain amino acid ABC transporter permease [Xanthobacteraceae bacterium]|nr:MAG: branched-chain amino acid ABC transporter permease [Xanthobacteraceae bacterium]
MSLSLFLVQVFNGLQYGLILFLIASGLTLIFGIMGIINLAHGAFYMLGAYVAFGIAQSSGSLVLAVLGAVATMAALGFVIERVLIGRLYNRNHLDQVLITFGLILVFDEAQRIIWGSDVHSVAIPPALSSSFQVSDIMAFSYYRIFVTVVCAVLAVTMALVIQKTKLGMWIRAGASNREMVSSLGVDINMLFALVFAAGAALTGFAGAISVPLTSVSPGMGDAIIIISFVVVVIGGVGSIKGAFFGALLIGLADTFGRVLLPQFSSFLVYAIMAGVLLWRPQGLFARA